MKPYQLIKTELYIGVCFTTVRLTTCLLSSNASCHVLYSFSFLFLVIMKSLSCNVANKSTSNSNKTAINEQIPFVIKLLLITTLPKTVFTCLHEVVIWSE